MLALLLACTGSSDTAAPTDTAPDAPPFALPVGAGTLEHDGLTREYILYRPDALPAGAPLVVVLHGYGGTAAGIQGYSGLDQIAAREGFAVVYPQGTRDAWSSTYWEVGYAFHDQSVDDVGFILALVDVIAADLGSDAGAIFSTGMSNGGDMSYRLACETLDRFAAVAPVAGCLMGVIAETCAPTGQPSLLEIHGTDDGITRWEGDPAGIDGYGPYLGTGESVGFFVSAYGLDIYEQEALPDTAPDDGSTVLAHRWSAADTSSEVWLYEIDGGRHDWPGADGNEDIDASEEIWRFFSRTLDRR
jgi:polyhydroxybutyrate depolymerase